MLEEEEKKSSLVRVLLDQLIFHTRTDFFSFDNVSDLAVTNS